MNRLFCTLVVLGYFSLNAIGASREAQWREVRTAIEKGLPRTAVTNLQPIYSAAVKERAWPEAVKALGLRISLEENTEGGRPEEKVTRLRQAMNSVPVEMKPVLETLLAHWYWGYYQQNRWRFLQRTRTESNPGADFTTWDLPRLFQEIDAHFQNSLAAEAQLKRIPVQSWAGLLEPGTMPDTWRPTLFDFLAFEALAFYTSAEQPGAGLGEDSSSADASLPVLASAEQFLAWAPGNVGSAQIRKAAAIYQNLLRFHQADPLPRLAFAHCDLERLTWGWNVSVEPEKNDRYREALRKFIAEYADFEISAVAGERLARLEQQQERFVEARTVALNSARAFPDTIGGKLCSNVVIQIESKSASISAEHVWNAPWPDIIVEYRNVEKVYFRAIPVDWESFLDRKRNRPESLSQVEKREILMKAPVLEWAADLPPTTDYKQAKHKLASPSSLKPGFYFIAASHDSSFGEAENMVSMCDVWVSQLALVTRGATDKIEGFVFEANSGEPLIGAQVDAWYLSTQGTRVPIPEVATDENGFFSVNGPTHRPVVIRARHDGREIATSDVLPRGPVEDPPATAQAFIFTDRALYRPGQMVQYKAIALRADTVHDTYALLTNGDFTVSFLDPNGKEIETHKPRINDYGSFFGTFTAPRDRLSGAMTIQVRGAANGDSVIRVEEYKRPKFQTVLEAPNSAPKLNERVAIKGMATSYTGAAVDGAQVSYRVVRQVRMPWWWGRWRGGFPGSAPQEIAHGSTVTQVDGSFVIEFVAKPDLTIAEKDSPSFVFQVSADVTDSTGETRSEQRDLRVGYTALEARIEADDWQTTEQPVKIKVSTTSLDGEPQLAEGALKVIALEAPGSVHRSDLSDVRYYSAAPEGDDSPDLSNPKNWPEGKLLKELGFTTATNGEAVLSINLPQGAYIAKVSTQDRFGKPVEGKFVFTVLEPTASALGIRVPHVFKAPKWELKPGEDFKALWGTGYERGRAFVEIEHRNRIIRRFWTAAGRTQEMFQQPVSEAMRGGFFVHITRVQENRAYIEHRKVEVPWGNKDLSLKWEHFISKLDPGQKETWTLVVNPVEGGVAARSAAELVATLYDESLDAFAPAQWIPKLNVFRSDYSQMWAQFQNSIRPFQHVYGRWGREFYQASVRFRSFPPELTQPMYVAMRRGGRGVQMMMDVNAAPAALAGAVAAAPEYSGRMVAASDTVMVKGSSSGYKQERPPSVQQVSARKNLNETAFFFPNLLSDSNGVVRISFTMPEALTKWHFRALAHDRALRSGALEDHAVTAKELMVQPNPPRFVREGDVLEFVSKISNRSDQEQVGQIGLLLNDAESGKDLTRSVKLAEPERAFSVPAMQSRSVSWRITIPDGCPYLTYKVVAAAQRVSDGEEGFIPVLSRRVAVTESLSLPIRGPATRKFDFAKLAKSGSSKTLTHQSLTLQVASNPAWYAVLALPYLMEYPHECAEQVFNRYYANALARHIAASDPKIRRVFDLWKNTPAVDSPLEKNPELKSVALQETPWVAEAQNESRARRNIGVLFDENRLNGEQAATLDKLLQLQLEDGAWPWFPGGKANDYITLYITAGFARLRHIGVDIDVAPAVRGLNRLDHWMRSRYEEIQKGKSPEDYTPSPTDALYLYARSFFIKDQPVPGDCEKAVQFFVAQARSKALKIPDRQTQGHLALALKRFDSEHKDSTPREIMKSLKERSVVDPELGRFWRDTELSWWWFRAPIETQALMIEAFDEVASDSAAVEECRIWLLKQKQTRDWKTTKATADAVYALLLNGRDLLSSDELVQASLGGVDVTPRRGAEGSQNKAGSASAVEPGTGFYEVRFARGEIKPAQGNIVLKKPGAGVAWGSLHWQYLEDISKVTPHTGTPLKLKKTLYKKVNSDRGPELQELKADLRVGDELVTRVELRVDRDMEYVHLKDQRGSGVEPVNVLSGYRYQDGLGYYESTRDTASHFFIDYLPKGVYVFEYSTRVQLRGEYQSGLAEIQCMYAPEFNSHSESTKLTVR